MPEPCMFELSIRLSNQAMCEREDIAHALEKTADRVRLSGLNGGGVRDLNGNTVGTWLVTGWPAGEEAEAAC